MGSRTQKRLGFGTIVWALIPTLSLGLLAFLPFTHAAIRLPNPRRWLVAASYVVAMAVVIGPLGAASNTSDTGAALFTAGWFGLIAVATVHAFLLRGQVFAPSALQPAMAAALAARELRQQARTILASDAVLARELRIGRPDLPREFDDGGLIDVNHVPEQVLVDRLGMSPAEAGRVVEARGRVGGFSSPEELGVFADVEDSTIDVIRDRLIFPAAR